VRKKGDVGEKKMRRARTGRRVPEGVLCACSHHGHWARDRILLDFLDDGRRIQQNRGSVDIKTASPDGPVEGDCVPFNYRRSEIESTLAGHHF
jgi:hypothetical protein